MLQFPPYSLNLIDSLQSQNTKRSFLVTKTPQSPSMAPWNQTSINIDLGNIFIFTCWRTSVLIKFPMSLFSLAWFSRFNVCDLFQQKIIPYYLQIYHLT